MDKTVIAAKAREYIGREEDAYFRDEVERLLAAGGEADWKELEDRFYRALEFGTGGLRGVVGGGLNRMNTLVVRQATQGLAAYIAKAFPQKAAAGTLSAVVAYDSRRFSKEFAEAAALTFAANGIRCSLFSGMRPTPELSFAIRRLGADTGVVVTASHNPPKYNGYKAYWNDGSQVIEPHDAGIIKEVNAVGAIQSVTRERALSRGLLVMIDKEIDEPFHAMIRGRLFRPALIKEKASGVNIVYTPLHGTGAMHVEAVLSGLGLKVITVPEQREGDGAFPTVDFPNPEEPAALKMAIELGAKEKADVVMATDPDADRFGAAVPDARGAFVPVTGNQMGVLLIDYVLLSLKEQNKLPPHAAVVNTIVTTGMQAEVAALYGVETLECLTGFKWIADLMRQSETGAIDKRIVFGCEESYGYLVEDEVRDKDGISAAAMTAEMTLYWRGMGKSLFDRLAELYEKTHYWEECGISKYFPGPEGPGAMRGILARWRESPPETLGGVEVVKIRDVNTSLTRFARDGRVEPVALPKSDVLQFFLADGAIVSARPSGTEPKIKFYATARETVGADGLSGAKARMARKLAAITRDLRSVIGE